MSLEETKKGPKNQNNGSPKKDLIAQRREFSNLSAELTQEEQETFETIIQRYGNQFHELPDENKHGFTWEFVANKLRSNPDKTLKAATMQDGGHLFAVTENGTLLFMDKGAEPVLYGYDSKDNLLEIHHGFSEKIKQVVKWANYIEIRQQVINDGYELFTGESIEDQKAEEQGKVEEIFTYMGYPKVYPPCTIDLAIDANVKEYGLGFTKKGYASYLDIDPSDPYSAPFRTNFSGGYTIPENRKHKFMGPDDEPIDYIGVKRLLRIE